MWKPGFGKKFVNLEPVQRSEGLLLDQLQLIPSQVELLQAGAEIQESLSVNADDPVLRKPQHLVRSSLIHYCTIFLRFPVF